MERVLEDAAPSLTLPHIFSMLSFPHNGGHTETNIYLRRAQTSYNQLLCFGSQLNSWNRSEQEIKGMYILGVIAIKSLSFVSLLCLEVILHHGFQMTYSVFV